MKIVTTQWDDVGMYYTFQGKRVNAKCKPMSMAWYNYCIKLWAVKEQDAGMYAAKLTVARKHFTRKGSAYANILRHLEDTES